MCIHSTQVNILQQIHYGMFVCLLGYLKKLSNLKRDFVFGGMLGHGPKRKKMLFLLWIQ